jgi:hypothetical protein
MKDTRRKLEEFDTLDAWLLLDELRLLDSPNCNDFANHAVAFTILIEENSPLAVKRFLKKVTHVSSGDVIRVADLTRECGASNGAQCATLDAVLYRHLIQSLQPGRALETPLYDTWQRTLDQREILRSFGPTAEVTALALIPNWQGSVKDLIQVCSDVSVHPS